MRTGRVAGTRAWSLFLLFAFLAGCATTQNISEENRRSIGTIKVNAAVQKAPVMSYLGPGTSVFFAFGAIGGAAAYAASVGPAKALQDFAEKNGIFIENIAFEEVDAAFRRSGQVKVSSAAEPADAVVNVMVYTYGFTVPHGFSGRLGPTLGIRCVMVDAAGNEIANVYDYVIRSPVETFTPEELRDDPRRIEYAWRMAARRVAGNLAASLGYGSAAPLETAAPAPAPAPASPASAIVASAKTSAPHTGIPAAGSQWAYGLSDRLYGRPSIDVMVRVTRVDGSSIDESVISRGAGQGETQRTVSAGTAGFLPHSLADGAELMEFAPYLLAASGTGASAVPVTAAGYPVGTGFPEWIARAGSQVWEQVSVPAGTFRALRVEISGRRARVPSDPNVSRNFEFRVWYAPEVQRYVRLEQKEWSIPGRQLSHNVVELVKFSPPP